MMKDRAKEESCEKAYSAQEMVKGQTNPWIFWTPDAQDIQACQTAQQSTVEKTPLARKR